MSIYSGFQSSNLKKKRLYKAIFNFQISSIFNQLMMCRARARERNKAQKIKIGEKKSYKIDF